VSVFSVSNAVGFIVGFVMFGAIIYIPLYLQTVHAATPTSSGLQLLPLVGGMLVTFTVSGRLVSKWGRYKIFPVIGTAVMTLGLFLFSLLTPTTPLAVSSVYMVVLGLGIGCVMQVLVVAVQNAVPQSQLGTATSSSTFFRSIGGSFGTAIFGAIFSNVLIGNLARHLHGTSLPSGFSSADATPALLARLPAAVHQAFVAGYAESIQTVFMVAVPIAALAFLATWLIPQVELKQWPAAASAAPAADPAVPGAALPAEALDPQHAATTES
jgi:MFS family permease